MFTYVFHDYLRMFTSDYPCLLVFTYVYTCLRIITEV